MPRPPHANPELDAVGGSVFSKLADRVRGHAGEVYALHVGDTWMAPPVAPDALAADPEQHRYAPPRGVAALVEAVAARLGSRHAAPTPVEQVWITAGATGGLSAVCGAILSPGDEVAVLAPYWPLVAGIVRTHRGVPVPVDLLDVDGRSAFRARLRAAIGPRTVAIYASTPNNPTGRALPAPWLEALVDMARAEGLWILADEVYEDHQHRGEHVPLRALAPERTASVHSFSKAYGLAGHRVGAVAVPAELAAAVGKVVVHTFYSVSRVSQGLALRALGPEGDAWLARARPAYAEAGRAAAARLGLPEPDGSTFLFVDVSAALDARGLLGLLEDAADRGLFLAPGPSFGAYPAHVRLCFTAAPPDVTARGVGVLAGLLGR